MVILILTRILEECNCTQLADQILERHQHFLRAILVNVLVWPSRRPHHQLLVHLLQFLFKLTLFFWICNIFSHDVGVFIGSWVLLICHANSILALLQLLVGKFLVLLHDFDGYSLQFCYHEPSESLGSLLLFSQFFRVHMFVSIY